MALLMDTRQDNRDGLLGPAGLTATRGEVLAAAVRDNVSPGADRCRESSKPQYLWTNHQRPKVITYMKNLKRSAAAIALAGLTIFSSSFVSGAMAADARPLIQAMQNSEGEPTLAPMLKNVIPAVVNISVKGTKEVSNNMLFNIPEEFRFMFPQLNQPNRQREFRALGSGVIIDAKEGYIVTNHHVVEDASSIRIALSDGREYEATKIGSDPHTDLALLKLKEFDNLTALPFNSREQMDVGDFVVAIGNPFGLGQTVTSGIISALGRTGLNIENIENFIQTDAAINSGNSGGALVNLRGELVGINTAILGPNGGNIGIGFAIPVDMVKTVVEQLKEFGEVRRGTLGVAGSELTPDLAENFGYKGKAGAFVNEVTPGGAAEKAGIKPGDIITSINGKKIKSFGELRAIIATLGSGADAKIGIFRDGKNLTVNATLTEPDTLSGSDAGQLSDVLEGATLTNNDGGGVLVSAVAPRSRAFAVGLREGDVITTVNRDNVKDLSDLKNKMSKSKSGATALRIQRGSSVLYLTIRR